MTRLTERADTQGAVSRLENRVRGTLDIAHRWGYAPTLEALAANLLGGPGSQSEVIEVVGTAGDLIARDGFVCIAGQERLLEKSKRRVAAHAKHNGWARTVAQEYAKDLARTCPLVECICLSGSTAAGGYDSTDDIDFDLFVVDDAKYLVFLVALLLGLELTLRNRRRTGFRKIACINVLWTESEWRPFLRQDQDLAYELLRCHPIIGEQKFKEVVAANGWARGYFPQLDGHSPPQEPFPEPSLAGRLLRWIGSRPRLLRSVNEFSRVATHAVYSFSHWLKRNDAESVERFRFLKRVKSPYEVFQD